MKPTFPRIAAAVSFICSVIETVIMTLPIVFVVFILWAAVKLEQTRAAAAVQIEAKASR